MIKPGIHVFFHLLMAYGLAATCPFPFNFPLESGDRLTRFEELLTVGERRCYLRRMTQIRMGVPINAVTELSGNTDDRTRI
jgi:hypothetical protein